MDSQQDKDLPRHYLGIDISKERIDICMINQTGKVQRTFQVSSDRKGYQKLCQSIPRNVHPVLCMESTGPHSGNLYNYLKKKGYECILSNAFEVSRLRDAFSKSVKTDRIDAFVLAQAARMNVLKHSSKDLEYIYLQDILERYYDLKDRRTALVNQLRANLVEIFPELPQVFKKIDSISTLTILQHCSSASSYSKSDLVRVKDIIVLRGGRTTSKKLEQLRDLSQETVAWKQSSFHERIIQSQTRELQCLKEELVFVENLLEEYVQAAFPIKMQLLQSIPGIGKTIAMQTLAVMGDHHRFDPDGDGKGAKRFSSFVGFGLREYSSGPRSRKGGISKRGNSVLRGQLFMAAFSAVRTDASIASFYERKKERGNGKLAAVSVAHLLVRRAYGVLKTGRMYNPAIPTMG